MKIQNLDIRLPYVPNHLNGKSLFDGVPAPSKEVLEIIDDKGVYHIEEKLKELLEKRKELKGSWKPDAFGFFHYQKFFDLQERIVFDIREVVNPENTPKNDYTISVGKYNVLLGKSMRPSYLSTYKALKEGYFFYDEFEQEAKFPQNFRETS